MKHGAFALLDCLGFRDAWKRRDPEEIVQFLENVQVNLKHAGILNTLGAYLPDVQQSIGYISDTVAISTQVEALPDKNPHIDGYAVLLAVQACAEVLAQFSDGPVPLTLRGHIALGAHVARNAFFLGPAVTEAAEKSETSQGAFVWLSTQASGAFQAYMQWLHNEYPKLFLNVSGSSALTAVEAMWQVSRGLPKTLLEAAGTGMEEWWKKLSLDQKAIAAPIYLRRAATIVRDDLVVPNYPMEMKVGGKLRVDVLNPLYLVPRYDRASHIAKILSSFVGQSVDVMQKGQNTARFLRAAEECSRKCAEKTDPIANAMYAELESVTGVRI